MITKKEDCPHTKVGKDSICKECGKRIIKSHKGGRPDRIACRVTNETKAMFDEIAAGQTGTKADCLESIIHDAYKRFKNEEF